MSHHRIVLLLLFTTFLTQNYFLETVTGHPNPAKTEPKVNSTDPNPGSSSEFKCKKYKECQISDTKDSTGKAVAGQCLKYATDLFVTSVGLTMSADFVISPDDVMAKMDKQLFGQLKAIARAASNLERPGYVAGLDSLPKNSAQVKTLKAGMICNKVMKLLGSVVYISIEIAKGKNRKADLEHQLKKLKNNVETDTKSAGQEMMSFYKLDKPPNVPDLR